jgi:Ser/Thr protein kinase RdoA (MazF antagonist)
MNDVEKARKLLKPCPSVETVAQVLVEQWGFDLTLPASDKKAVTQIDSYDDANFYVKTANGNSYLVKFYNGSDSASRDIINGYSGLLHKINGYFESVVDVPAKSLMPSNVVRVPKFVPSLAGQDIVYVEGCEVVSGSVATVGLAVFVWIEGTPMNRVGMVALSALGVGRAVGLMTVSLNGFDNAAFHRYHAWDLASLNDCAQFIQYVEDEDLRVIIPEIIAEFNTKVLPASAQFAKSVIMADCNDANVIVNAEDTSVISGIIDFGDAVYTWTVNDIAIALAYGLLTGYGLEYPHQTLAIMLGGYSCFRTLTELEIEHISCLIASRLCTSISIGAYSIHQNPANREYLSVHSRPAKTVLRRLYTEDREYMKTLITRVVNAGRELQSVQLTRQELVDHFIKIEADVKETYGK